MTDEKTQLRLVSPCLVTPDWDGRIFADLEASFSQPSLRYHCVGNFMFSRDSLADITRLAQTKDRRGKGEQRKPPVLKMKTVQPAYCLASRDPWFQLRRSGQEGDSV